MVRQSTAGELPSAQKDLCLGQQNWLGLLRQSRGWERLNHNLLLVVVIVVYTKAILKPQTQKGCFTQEKVLRYIRYCQFTLQLWVSYKLAGFSSLSRILKRKVQNPRCLWESVSISFQTACLLQNDTMKFSDRFISKEIPVRSVSFLVYCVYLHRFCACCHKLGMYDGGCYAYLNFMCCLIRFVMCNSWLDYKVCSAPVFLSRFTHHQHHQDYFFQTLSNEEHCWYLILFNVVKKFSCLLAIFE